MLTFNDIHFDVISLTVPSGHVNIYVLDGDDLPLAQRQAARLTPDIQALIRELLVDAGLDPSEVAALGNTDLESVVRLVRAS